MGFVDRGGGREAKKGSLRKNKKNIAEKVKNFNKPSTAPKPLFTLPTPCLPKPNPDATHDPIIDAGCNLMHRLFEQDLQDVGQRAFGAGVEAMVLNVTNFDKLESAFAFAKNFETGSVLIAGGLHPDSIKKYNEKQLEQRLTQLKDLLLAPEAVAVTTGLSFEHHINTQYIQEKCLVKQLEMATEIHLPVVFSTEEHDILFEKLQQYRAMFQQGMIFNFLGSEEALSKYLELDLHIGISGLLCAPDVGASLQGMLGKIPQNRLLITSNCPLNTPQNLEDAFEREAKNEPSNIYAIVKVIAKIWNKSEKETAAQIRKNTMEFYSIPEYEAPCEDEEEEEGEEEDGPEEPAEDLIADPTEVAAPAKKKKQAVEEQPPVEAKAASKKQKKEVVEEIAEEEAPVKKSKKSKQQEDDKQKRAELFDVKPDKKKKSATVDDEPKKATLRALDDDLDNYFKKKHQDEEEAPVNIKSKKKKAAAAVEQDEDVPVSKKKKAAAVVEQEPEQIDVKPKKKKKQQDLDEEPVVDIKSKKNKKTKVQQQEEAEVAQDEEEEPPVETKKSKSKSSKAESKKKSKKPVKKESDDEESEQPIVIDVDEEEEVPAKKSKKNEEQQVLIMDDDVTDDNDNAEDDQAQFTTYVCIQCRTKLFTSDTVIAHNAEKAKEFVTSKKKTATDTAQQPCQMYFVQHEPWMLVNSDEKEATLACPKCNSKIGTYTTHGSQCSCGVFVAPARKILKSRIEALFTGRPLDLAPIVAEDDDEMKKEKKKKTKPAVKKQEKKNHFRNKDYTY